MDIEATIATPAPRETRSELGVSKLSWGGWSERVSRFGNGAQMTAWLQLEGPDQSYTYVDKTTHVVMTAKVPWRAWLQPINNRLCSDPYGACLLCTASRRPTCIRGQLNGG
jgi:hypothetical protein